ncbi:MAG: poly(3-hydroxybutyrate) depolymerase [Myxococcota bacterium]|jgi:poly(3-hydroxybutyrate) depolymerase
MAEPPGTPLLRQRETQIRRIDAAGPHVVLAGLFVVLLTACGAPATPSHVEPTSAVATATTQRELPTAAAQVPDAQAEPVGAVTLPTRPPPLEAPKNPAWWPTAPRDGAWVESRKGFVNRWLVQGPLTDRKLRRLKSPGDLAEALETSGEYPGEIRTFRAERVHFDDDPSASDRKATPIFLLRARVHAPVATSVLVMTGATGKASVSLNGVEVFQTESKQRLLADHHRIPTTLRAGWNDVWVQIEKLPRYPISFMLRLRGPDNLSVPGLQWDTPPASTREETLCEAFVSRLRTSLTAEGWHVEASISSVGLLPITPVTWSLGTAGTPQQASPLNAAMLAEGAPSLQRQTVPSSGAPGPAKFELRIASRVCGRSLVDPRPALQTRLFKVIDTITTLKLAEGDTASLLHHASRVRERLEAAADADLIGRDLRALETLALQAKTTGRPYDGATGVVTRAYTSRMDGTLQRYLVHVPASYPTEPERPRPLVVAAHGLFYTAEDMLQIASGQATPTNGATVPGSGFDFEGLDAFVVAPEGYGEAGQRPPGEADVLRVIEEMRAAYPINTRRITLTGFSLGGSVAFWVAFHNPDIFAGAAPLCGYPNVSEYSSIKWARKKPWERALLEHEGIANYAEGGRYIPLRMVHGENDKPERSELVAGRYQALNYPVTLEVVEGAGHNIWDHAFSDGLLLRWLTTRKQPAEARAPRVKTARYRHGKSYWLRLDVFTTYGDFGALRGRKRKGDRLTVDTDNVDSFSILASALPSLAGKAIRLQVDRQRLGEVTLSGDLYISRVNGKWSVLAEPPALNGEKRAGLEGPLRDIWFSPFVVVYGTQDPSQTEANHATALEVSRYNMFTALDMPVKRDDEVTAADLRGRGVVLVGNPASNRWTREAAPALGVGFEPDALTFDGTRYTGEDVGISLIRPSPFDSDHYAVLHAGVGAEGTLAARYLPEFVPDYLVYDKRMTRTWWDKVMGKRDALAGGFFNQRWQR